MIKRKSFNFAAMFALHCIVALHAASAGAAVFQYAVPAKTVDGKEATAFLWVPPQADRIRGVFIGGLTLMEEHFSQDPIVRQACAAEKLAIVYLSPSIDSVFDYKGKNSADLLQKALTDLAAASGYREIAVAPLFPYGHSVGTLFASHVVCWKPDRCFGALLFKGGISIPANDPAASLAGVPILAIKGQFEEFGPGPSGVLRDFEDREAAWKGMRDAILKLREKDDHHLVSLLVEPGASHFAWSPSVAPLVASFIREAAQRRIPDWPEDANEPVRCRPIDPASGALTDAQIGQPAAPAAACADFKGEPKHAFWHLSLDLARASDLFHRNMLDKKPQFVAFTNPATGKPMSVGHDLRLKMAANWTGPDSFKVARTFLDRAPDKYPKADAPVGHAAGPIHFRAFGGDIEQTAADTFRISLTGRGRLRADILAYHDGDDSYRHAEQQGRITLPERLTKGTKQTITFPAPGVLQIGGTPLPLTATSDAGLKVRYYVLSGPAMIDGETLKLAEVPARAVFPITVTVVAYQYGSAVEPMVQSAEPMPQTVLIRR